jgi:hypothetical protein
LRERAARERNAAVRAGAFLIIAGFLAGPGQAAEQPPICADRPGKATGTCTAPAGHWQIETGLADWSLQKGGGERDTALVLGETTIKYGLTDSADVEVDVTPWQHSGGASGIGDVSLIYKQRLTSSDAPLQVALRPFVKAPTAKHSLGNGKWEAGLLVPVGYAIPRSPFSIALTPEMDWAADADGHGHHAAMAEVAAIGWAASDRLNLSAELWGSWDWDPSRTTRQASADGSVAYLLGNDVQLDAGANFGLNRATPDVEIYTGVAVRF